MSRPPLDEIAKAKALAREAARGEKELSDKAFMERFAAASERGAALSVVAFLDSRIDLFLMDAWIEDGALGKDMLRPEGGPLSSLGAKIKLCRLLGYVSKRTYDDLSRIAKVRNMFAHSLSAESFDFPAIAALCTKLLIFENPVAFFCDGEEAKHHLQFYEDFGYDLRKHRWGFIAAVGFLGNKLHSSRSVPKNVRNNHIRECL